VKKTAPYSKWSLFVSVVVTLCFVLQRPAVASTGTSVQVGISPSEMHASIGKDGLPLVISPTLIFENQDDGHATIELISAAEGSPSILTMTSAAFGSGHGAQRLPMVINPPTSTLPGVYVYQWKITLISEHSNLQLVLPFKLTLQVFERESDIKEPYIWNDEDTDITFDSPIQSISLSPLRFIQRNDERARLSIEVHSTYPRTIENLPTKNSIAPYHSLSSLGEALQDASTLIIPPGTTTKAIPLPPLPVGVYKISTTVLDKSTEEIVIVTPKYGEMAAIALIPSCIVLAWALTRKKKPGARSK